MPPTRAPRPAVLLVLGACLTLLTALVPASAARGAPASGPLAKPPKPTISSVTARLDQLARQAERLAESYNQATIQVRSAERAAATAKQHAATARAEYARARQRFAAMITAQYETGAFSSTGALLTSHSQDNYLEQIAMLDMLSRQQADIVQHVQTTRGAANTAANTAATLLTQARRHKAALAARRTAVSKQTAKFRALLDTLTNAQQQAYANRDAATPSQSTAAARVHAGNAAAQRAIDFALAQVGKPYVFGAAGPSAYDCSGLTMAAWQRGGVSLPHLASAQYTYGTHVGADQLQPGDLVFLYQPIGHVSIYIGHGMLVSAPQPGENVKIVPFAYFRSDFTGATRLT